MKRSSPLRGHSLRDLGRPHGTPRPQASESRHDLRIVTHARCLHKPRSTVIPDENSLSTKARHAPWNKGKLIGAKPPLRPNQVWSIRTRLLIERRTRDLALFNLAIDSKLRGCDVVALRVEDVAPNGYAADRATVRQKKTGRPVKFELTDQTLHNLSGRAARARDYSPHS